MDAKTGRLSTYAAELSAGESGDYPPAPAAASAPVAPVPARSAGPRLEDPAELLRAADDARLGGDPARAVVIYRRMLAQYPRDPRAPLASFSLGRVLLDQLGRPREAAAAFAAARTGELAEDALAREVEAWSRAGDEEQARALAERYLRTYPAGRRASAMKRHAGP